MSALEHNGKVEPAYVRWGYGVLIVLIVINTIFYCLDCSTPRCNAITSILHEHNPTKKYFTSLVLNGVRPTDASRVDAFIVSGWIICCCYLLTRVIVEFFRGDTIYLNAIFILKLLVILIICLCPIVLLTIDASKGAFSLTVRHSEGQNIAEITILSAWVVAVAGEIIAQIIAFSRDRYF